LECLSYLTYAEEGKNRSAIVATLSKKLLDFDFRDPGLKNMWELVHGYLETRVSIISSRKVIIYLLLLT
jgi:hypothetical protein